MKAMILAAGRGERMRPLTDHTPKPLLQCGKHRLIEYHLLALKEAGFSQIVINHAHLGEMIEQTLGDGSAYGLQIDYSAEGTALETGGGIFRALKLLGEEPFLVINGDVWTDYPFVQLRNKSVAKAHIVLIDNPPHNTKGDFALQGDRVCRITEQNSGFTYSGIGIYSASFFAGCEDGAFPLAPLLFKAIDNGTLTGEHFTGSWMDIGTPERLKQLEARLA